MIVRIFYSLPPRFSSLEFPPVYGIVAALSLVRQEVEKKTDLVEIFNLLTKNGYTTRTGRDWTAATLRTEIYKLKETSG